MQIVINIPDIPKNQEIIMVDFHFIDGQLCECNYPFKVLPPHGRLGDLDVLLEESLKEGAYNYVDSWQIADAPTILEAERRSDE